MPRNTTLNGLLKDFTRIIEVGGKAAEDNNPRNPYMANTFEAQLWRFGFENKMSECPAIKVDQFGYGSSDFGTRPYTYRKGYEPPERGLWKATMGQPCPSISKNGKACERLLGHDGVHECHEKWNPWRRAKDWQDVWVWTTEEQAEPGQFGTTLADQIQPRRTPCGHSYSESCFRSDCPTARKYRAQCGSISRCGHVCDQALGHNGIHSMTIRGKHWGDLVSLVSWTTEQQSVDSGAR